MLNSGRCLVRAGSNAKDVKSPKIVGSDFGNYTRNVSEAIQESPQ